jgi:hypothetical protein
MSRIMTNTVKKGHISMSLGRAHAACCDTASLFSFYNKWLLLFRPPARQNNWRCQLTVADGI